MTAEFSTNGLINAIDLIMQGLNQESLEDFEQGIKLQKIKKKALMFQDLSKTMVYLDDKEACVIWGKRYGITL